MLQSNSLSCSFWCAHLGTRIPSGRQMKNNNKTSPYTTTLAYSVRSCIISHFSQPVSIVILSVYMLRHSLYSNPFLQKPRLSMLTFAWQWRFVLFDSAQLRVALIVMDEHWHLLMYDWQHLRTLGELMHPKAHLLKCIKEKSSYRVPQRAVGLWSDTAFIKSYISNTFFKKF